MKFRLSALVASLGLAVAASAAHADVVKIAFVGPTTGPLTQYGDMVQEGMNTAIEKINSEGGVDGHTFQLVAVDDACEPKQGPTSANSVVNQKIGFVVGPVCSGATLGSSPIFDEQGIVMVTPSATAPAVTDGKNFHFIFRTIGRDDQQGPVAAKFIASQKVKKVAILHDKQSYGQGVATSVRDNLKKAGIEPVMFEGINAGESDYSSVITKLKSAGVDFVYYGGYHPELGLLLRQGREQGLKARFMGPEGAGNAEINAIAGNAVEGMLVTFPPDFSTKPGNEGVAKMFKDKGRDPSGAFQLGAYAAIQAITSGIKGAKSTEPEKVADWLHANKVSTVIGDLSWEPSGDLTSYAFDIFEWHKDGSKTLVK
ncbi:high-affinity branched-chain amino acid ABC transporter substrate-binding protein [Pelistega europaea]|uniref:High-affinity branched-chain amino acid ABC transporter substrate-binding protein n=1 Tax=Pelistega europaea TaxID=106147 RepID=A0A7Y4LA27_9BURK|nr:high-affinity branched-chain amino acid ABC transporter substrate-binding protein [Pelistega europaea]NOL49713.1 high-affinity branched-chain amino acid ABC transporter substrate-binding protein [Pelistega europaea]